MMNEIGAPLVAELENLVHTVRSKGEKASEFHLQADGTHMKRLCGVEKAPQGKKSTEEIPG